jgi:PTS system nitrogen regulatory IIA component
MPHEQMNEKQVAAYLHMDLREVQKLSSRGKLPCRKIRQQYVFSKGDLDHWVEAQIHELDAPRLKQIEKGVSAHHGFDREGLLVWPMLPPGGVANPLKATSRDAVIRSLVKLADDAELVLAKDALIAQIRKREELCSTAIAPGIALPHPRYPLPYEITNSFVVVGLTSTGIPYGSADGSLTRLFFLICCKDDRTHLHVLARIGRMLQDQSVIDRLLESQSAKELRDMLYETEQAVSDE